MGRPLVGSPESAQRGFSIATQLPPEQQAGWRQVGEQLLNLREGQGTGLVIAVPDLLNEGVATFLRRADRIDLHAVAIDEVETSYRETFEGLTHPIDPALIRTAAESTGGYPFLIQLVGHHVWQLAEATDAQLTAGEVDLALSAAHRRNTRVVIDAALSTVSPKGLEFLRAMSVDDDPATTADIGQRLGNRKNTIGNYRARLIDAGLIQAAGRGRLDFAIPGLREHFRRL